MNLDPITFEVVKHRLWQINDEQGVTIRTIATSPIVVEGNDFNVGLFTRDGELVVAGPYVLTHVTTMDAVIQNVIKLTRDINDGDMFLVNDPYLGALHQNDVAVVSPLYQDGQIMMWMGNVIHHADVGGIDEGSFCVNATNVHQEPPRYFLKVVDRGCLSPEVERTFVMNSRLPDMVALDLRAQIGAINIVRRRLQELVQERGAETVLAVMKKSVDYAEEQLRGRLAELPDGSWYTEVYMDGDRVGSDRIYRVCLRLDKKGSELFFDYSGTDPQAPGAVNSTYYACYAGTTTPVYAFLCGGEIDWNSSIRRCVHVKAPEGTVMHARYPAAVSICSIGFTWLAAVASMNVVAQMFSASEKYRDRVCPSWSVSCNANNLFGTNQKGKRVGALLSDHRGIGAGARSFNDGFDHAGQIFSYLSFMSDVESQEWKLPLLYLFRRQLPDSGGPGKYRGGLTILTGVVPYKTDKLIWKSQNTAGADQTNALGIDGGYPGAGSQVSVARKTPVWAKLAKGEIPLTYADVGGDLSHLPSKSDGVLGPDDVFVYYPSGGGGYGDPVDRDPQRVRDDVERGVVSLEWARKAYGVVLSENLEVDDAKTRKERDRIRAERIAEEKKVAGVKSAKPAFAHDGSVLQRLGEYLEVVASERNGVIRCRKCQYVFCSRDEDPRHYAIVRKQPLAAAGPWLAKRWEGESPHFTLRECICPSCGTLFDTAEVLQARAT